MELVLWREKMTNMGWAKSSDFRDVKNNWTFYRAKGPKQYKDSVKGC